MTPSAQGLEHASRVVFVGRFAQDLAVALDHRVAAQHESFVDLANDVGSLLASRARNQLGRPLVAAQAALRGFGRRRIAAMLLWESALLVGAGGLLALPLGGALALLLDRILRQMPGLPERLHFFVFEPRALVIHVALFVITAAAAAAYPMWLTARLPIAATLRREVVG